MSDLFAELNGSQSEAVSSTEGYYRIIAGAGSGKTRTLTHRFAYLVRELGVPPQNILCVTFTNKAAAEMKSRIKKLLGSEVDASLVTTYHGFCVKVLKEDINRLFFPSNFKILDVKAQKKIIEEIYAGYDIKMDYKTFEETLSFIYREKTHLNYIPMMVDPAYSFNADNALSLEEKIYIKYLEYQKKIYGLDFNDLLYFAIYLFEHNEDILVKWQTRLHYIQVDEFQDSSKKELDIINMMCKVNNNLFVVGDPDQNIYEWRSSDNRFLVHFDKNYPNVKTIFLTQNYRSTPEILNVGNNLISKNVNRVPKDLFTENPPGMQAEHAHFKNDEDQAKWLTAKINEIAKKNNDSYTDIAVLFRSSFLSRWIEQTLYHADIPYIIHGGVNFFDRTEIRDSVAFLKLINDENDDEAFLRIVNVPRRQIGKTRIDLLRQAQKYYLDESGKAVPLYKILEVYSEDDEDDLFGGTGAKEFVEIINYFRARAAEGMKVSEILSGVLERTGYKAYISRSGDMERFDNVTELLASISEFELQAGENVSLAAYIQQLAVTSDYESERVRNCVKLMTIHSAKGLEFPYVIIAGMTDGVFPSRRTLEERQLDGLEEERRLCYVAVTRAMRELYFIESENGAMKQLPSRFLYEVEEQHIKRVNEAPQELVKNVAAKAKQIGKQNTLVKKPGGFRLGDSVRHKVFGIGTIASEDSKSYYVNFENSANPKPIAKNFSGLARADAPIIDMPVPQPQTPPDPEQVKPEADKSPEPKKADEKDQKEMKKEEIIFDDWHAPAEKRTPFAPIIKEAGNNFKRKLDTVFKSKKAQREPENFEIPAEPESVEPENFEMAELEKIESEIIEEPIEIGKMDEMDDFTKSFFDAAEMAEQVKTEEVRAEEAQPDVPAESDLKADDAPRETARKEDAAHEDFSEPVITGEADEMNEAENPGMPVSLYNAPPQILFDNEERVNLWNDPNVPKKGWVCIDVIDLGAPFGECGMCGKEDIRYVHIMRHEQHQSIGSGCVCAGNMESDANASKERENTLKNKINRYATFVNLDLKISKKGNPYTKYKDTVITFMEQENKDKQVTWTFVENGEFSGNHKSLEEAKRAAFEKVDTRRK